MKILHADDDAVCCEVFRLMLTTEGQHQVTTAGDGEEAWKLLTDSGQHFDVAVIDLMMPKLDGLGLVERIRSTPATSALPVVLCTALNDRTTVARAAQLGVSQYIVKPYKKALVLERIRRIEEELTKATPCESAAIVCERLGVPEAALAGLIKSLLANIRAWATDGRSASDSSAFQRLAIAANGYKGSCLNLGLLALSDEMEAMETLLTAQAGLQQRAISLTAPPEVLAGLQRIQNQVDRAVAVHHLGA
jgi:CheY-like chemotaxis protein